MMKQQLRTKHDTNGNPRRVWILYNDRAEVVKVKDEGYAGDPFREYPLQLPCITITPREYRDWIKRA